MFEALLKSMGYDPDDFKAKMTHALLTVQTFDRRLSNIEQALGVKDEELNLPLSQVQK